MKNRCSCRPACALVFAEWSAHPRVFRALAVLLLTLAAAQPARAVSASGGTVTMNGGYIVHTFTNVGTTTFSVSAPGSVELLVVAGGGGGGRFAGGGGAGGLIYSSAFAVTGGDYTVTVGAGGAGSTVNNTVGARGANSVFGTLTAFGGGGGGSRLQGGNYSGQNGAAGGSGGGGSPADAAPQGLGGAATNGQGSAGGNGGNWGWGGGGGGGAGAAGGNASGNNAGAGGIGVACAISGASVYYAGGGGGGTYYNGGGPGTAAAGGLGGGGAGQKNNVGTDGTANTGGGGGGGAHDASTPRNGGAGGSGIVIVRYLANATAPIIANDAVASVQTNSASLNGYLTQTGNSPVTVSVVWDVTNGGLIPATWTWAHTNTFAQGQWAEGDHPTTNITPLATASEYFYTYFAENASSTAVASPAQYFITGELGLSATDAAFGTSFADTATVVVSRPGTCTSQALPVTYSLGGTAVKDTDYTIGPASGFAIPAGQASATITVTTAWAHYFGAPKSVTLTLTPGPYAIGSAGSATCNLVGQQQTGYAGAKIYWNDGDGGSGTIASAVWGDNNTLDYAVWDQIQQAIGLAGNNPATPGLVKLAGDFVRTTDDDMVGTLQLTNANLTLSGGWNSTFTTQSGRSVLNANAFNAGGNQFRVLQVAATNVLLQSVVLTNGWAVSGGGGGALITSGGVNARLQNLVVANNTCPGGYAGNSGGGIGIADAPGVRISDSDIYGNSACETGGGISLFSQDPSFAPPVIIERCRIRKNRTTQSNYNYAGNAGGGIALGFTAYGSPKVVVANCVIEENQSRLGSGISLAAYGDGATATIFGCLIVSNSWNTPSWAPGQGNALYTRTWHGTARLVNCTVADNTQTSMPGQSGLYFSSDNYSTWRMNLINCVTKSNDVGLGVERKVAGGQRFMDFQNTTVQEASYMEFDVVEGSLTNFSFAAAISTNGNVTPGFEALTTNGAFSHVMEANIDGPANFRGKDPAPYQLTSTSGNALNNGLTKTDNRGFRYVDVNLDNVYTTNTDIIVSGAAPDAGPHLVYTMDLLGNPRVSGREVDRGAYESLLVSGTTLYFR